MHLDVKGLAKLQDAVPREDRVIDLGAPCKVCAIRRAASESQLTEEDETHLLSIASNVHLASGQLLFAEGEAAEHLYSVVEGTMRLCKMMPDGRRQITGFLFPGDFLGLADDDVYAYSAEAVGRCSLYRYSFAQLRQLIERYPDMEHKLCAIARHELAEAQDQLLLLGRKTARERVASFLVMLLERAARHGQEGNRLTMPMTREDIADYLGMATETISRTFTEFRSEGLIASDHVKDITLLERDTLETIAGGLD